VAYPSDLKALTSLRFVAAFWLLLYHFRDHLGFGLDEASGFIAMGKLGVDLFFVLSGFILAHVYLPEVERGSYHHGRFLWLRLARVYPLHLITLLGMVVIWGGATLAGVSFGAEGFKLADLPAHLLLLQAWGTVGNVGWNFPSWSVSAEWFAYLCFPLFAWVAVKLRNRPWVMLSLAALLLIAFDRMTLGLATSSITERTSNFGILRIIPSFGMGVALYLLGTARPLATTFAWPLVIGSLGWIVIASELRVDPLLVFPGLLGLVFGLAEVSRRGLDGAFGGRAMVYLGEVSYAVYMVHLLVDIVWYHGLERFGISAASPDLIKGIALVGAILASIAAAIIAHHAVEKPARVIMRRWSEGWFVPKGMKVAAE